MINQYDKEIKKEQANIELYILGMKVAAECITYSANNKERAKKNVNGLIQKLVEAKSNQKSRFLRILTKVLKEELRSQLPVRRILVVHLLRAKMLNKNYDETFFDKLVDKIPDNPSLALINFASDYISSVTRIESLKRNEELSNNNGKDEVLLHLEANEPVDLSIKAKSQKRALQFNTTPEGIRQLINEKLARGDEHLSDAELDMIANAYPDMERDGQQHNFYTGWNLQKLYEIKYFRNELSSKSNLFNFYNIIALGYRICSILEDDLLSEKSDSNDLNSIFERFNIRELLQQYQAAYNDFQNYYSQLDSEQRTYIDLEYSLRKYDYYREKFGIKSRSANSVATVEDIKRVVNSAVKTALIESPDYIFILFDDETQSFNGAHRLAYATKYMSVEEIVELYKDIKKQQVETVNSFDDEKPKGLSGIKEGLKEFLESLQANFANAIRYRMTNSVLVPNATEEERENFKAKRDMDLVAICREYFQEEPIFDVKYAKKGEVDDKRAAKRLETGLVIEKAQVRFYGMNKVQQALSRMNLSKLNQLGKKDILTDNEMRLVNKMF